MKSTVRAGMLIPMAKVSVANKAWEEENDWFSHTLMSKKGNRRGGKKTWLLHLEQAFREKDLYGLLQDGQQASMMDSDPPLQQRQHVLHLTITHTQRAGQREQTFSEKQTHQDCKRGENGNAANNISVVASAASVNQQLHQRSCFS